MSKTRDVLTILDRMVGKDAELGRLIAEESVNAAVARMIYEARTKAGLTQRQLAERIGTKQPVIARLEDADYEGHSLSMLTRIAAALDQTIVLRMAPAKKTTAKRRSKRAS